MPALFFGRYVELAAKHGGEELLEYLMTTGQTIVDMGLRARLFKFAAKAGRMEIIQFLYDFRREDMPW